MEKRIESISPQTIEAIKNRSAYKLPNNPSERGFKTEDIKGAFWRAEFDGEMSIMGQLKKIVDRLNEILPQTLDNTQIVDDLTTEDSSKVASANQLVVLKRLIDNFDYNNLKNLPNIDGAYLYDNVSGKNTNGSITQKAISDEFDLLKNGNYPLAVKKNDGTMAQITEDRNGFLRVENQILETRKVISSGGYDVESRPLILNLSESLNYGDSIEVWWEIPFDNYNSYIQGKSTAVFTGFEGMSGQHELSFSMVSCPQISNAKLITIRGYALSPSTIKIHKMYSDSGELEIYPIISRVVKIKDNYVS